MSNAQSQEGESEDMHERVCLAREISNDEVDVRILDLFDLEDGTGYLEVSYGSLDGETTRQRSPAVSMNAALGLYVHEIDRLERAGYFRVDETDYTETPIPAQQLATGTRFLGKYWIHGLLGSGGQGDVYLAQNMLMNGRQVALKLLRSDGKSEQEQEEAVRRFRQEMAFLIDLEEARHPSIPIIYGFEVVNGIPMMEMQYIAGESLQQKLDRSTYLCPLWLAIEITLKLCDVLNFLHSQKPPIVYRDLKPSNVMIDNAWQQLYLIDFGIARFYDPKKKRDTVVMGSPGYISPESVAGQQTTPRSDIYSLGALFHCLLTGEDPDAGEPFTFSSVKKRFPGDAHSLDTIIARMTAKRPDERYASMREVKKALEGFKKKSNTRTVRVATTEKKGIVFLINASLLSDALATDKVMTKELYDALYKDVRAAGYVIWHRLLGKPESEEERRATFLEQLEKATVIVLSITPDLVQTSSGTWMLEAAIKTGKPVCLAPMQTCQLPAVLLRQRSSRQPFVSAAKTPQEREARLKAIIETVVRVIKPQENIA